jgi:hypothetical protein
MFCSCLSLFLRQFQTCNAHAPYCHPWPVHLYKLFSTLSHKGTISRKKVIDHKKYILILSTTSIWNFSHSKNKWTRCYHKCKLGFMKSTHFCQILLKRVLSRQISEKYSNTKCHEKTSSGSWVVPYGPTDRYDETNSRFSQSYEWV